MWQLCGRKRTHPFREEPPCSGLVSAARELEEEKTNAKSAHRMAKIPLTQFPNLQVYGGISQEVPQQLSQHECNYNHIRTNQLEKSIASSLIVI